MNPASYGPPPPHMQQQYGGMMQQTRAPGPPRPSGPPPNSFNGVDSFSPGDYGPPGQPKLPPQQIQNGPPQANQNRPLLRPSYPQAENLQKSPMMGVPPGAQMMQQRGPAPMGPGLEQVSQPMGGLSISQPQQFPYGQNSPQGTPMRPPLSSPNVPHQHLNNNYQPPPPPGPTPYGYPPNTGPPSNSIPSGGMPQSRLPGPPMPGPPHPGPHLVTQSGLPQMGVPQHGVSSPSLQTSPYPQSNPSVVAPQPQSMGQFMPPGGPMMPSQQNPTPPLSSVNIGGSQPPPGSNMYAQQQPGSISGPSLTGGQPNGPVNNAYGQQYPGGMQMRYPSAGQPGYPQPPNMQAQGQQQGYQPNAQNRMVAPQNAAPQNQSRRLDPDQMPSPIQVIEDDRKNKGGEFFTNTKGQVPPLVTTTFSVHDEGICSPRFMRSTIYSIPCSPDMLKQMAVPFAISVCPFAKTQDKESPPPISNLKDTGPVRCNRCKAYMCAFMQFIDGGRRFQCVFCKGTTEVPPEYFAHLDHMGQRVDKFQRPELCLGSFEYIATKEYCRNGEFPKPPAFIFMIDVSFASQKSGMVNLLCQNMKKILANLPKDVGQEKSTIRVGFVTYSNVIHFYNVKANLAQPQMMVVADVTEMFVPLIDGFLVSLEESESVIDSLFEQIPLLFTENRETEVVLGPVIQAGLEALKAADCSGKLFIFHSSLPTAEAPGKLKNRDDRKLLGTDKEKTILAPQNTFYNNLGQECVAASCCVDLFLFPNTYIDIATISQISKLTGGQVYKYSYFQSDIDGLRFLEDLQRDVEKPIAFEAVMRVRTSTGIRPTDFFGNYYMSNTTDVELAAIDCDKALSVEIKYDDKLTEEDGAYIQTAVLYTSCGGQRRLRCLNLSLNTCNQMADLYRNCELDTVVNFLAKQALRHLLEQAPRQIKDNLITRGAQILATYRKNCASPSSVGQLILPECMKLLPLYINCLLKNDALSGGSDMAVDDRSYSMACLNSMDIINTVGYFYPRLLPLHDLDVNATELPNALRCSVEKVREQGAYLLENGHYMFIWLGQGLSPEWLQDVFSVQTTARVDPEKPVLLDLNTPMSIRVKGIINQIKDERNRCMKMVIVRQGDKLEIVFRQFLVEDRTGEASVSYVDFLCHLHKEIRNLLT